MVSPITGKIAGTPESLRKAMMMRAVESCLLQGFHLPQQIREMPIMNLVVVLPNTMTSFLNMRTASPPIQNTDASEK